MAKISIVIPCYFNEDNIPITGAKLLEAEKLFPEGTDIEYIFVDDGSKDNTFGELLKFHYQVKERSKIIKLQANVGSYTAVLAGFEMAESDCVAVISADLQDPPTLLPQMFGHWSNGEKLIVANRQKRNDGWIDSAFSTFFHYLIKKFAIKNIPEGGFDVVLMDSVIIKEIVRMKEKNTNVFYLAPFLGYTPLSISYERQKREIGKSRWTFQKKVKLLIDSFIAFSFLPVRIISVVGFFLSFIALIYAFVLVILKIMGKIEIEGWTGLMVVLLFVSSFQMISIGILGEYIWRTLDAVRNRPLYIIDKVIDSKKQNHV
jgi:polyisoprenyl-phosphate glycosyltransferase